MTPYLSCDPNDEDATPVAQELLSGLYSNLIAVWNVMFPPTLTKAQMEDRKIYNTHMFGQGNGGHEFNAVLTDTDCRSAANSCLRKRAMTSPTGVGSVLR